MHLSILSRTNDICFPVFRFEPKGFTMPLTHKTYAFGLFPAHECPPVSEARTPTKKAGTQRKQLDLLESLELATTLGFMLGFRVWASHAGPQLCQLGVAHLNALLGFRTLGRANTQHPSADGSINIKELQEVAQLTGQFLCKDANKPHCGHHMRHPTGDLFISEFIPLIYLKVRVARFSSLIKTVWP